MESQSADVVVVGGGLSGLSAAYYLLKKDRGIHVTLLEAKDRIGGRTLTMQLKSADGTFDFWDLGGEWVGRPQPHLNYLLKKFRMDTFNPVDPHNGPTHVATSSMSYKARLDLFQFTWKLQRLQNRLKTTDLCGSVEALKMDGMTLEEYKNKHLWTQEAKVVVDEACHCLFGVDPASMTLMYFLMYVHAAGGLETFSHRHLFSGKECRVKGGLQQLSTHLFHRIGRRNIRLGQPVTDVVQTSEGVTVVTSKRLQITCRRVIVAVPPQHAAAIKYTPALPSSKINLLKSVPLGFIVKFAITFDEAFWREEDSKQANYGFQTVLEEPRLGPVGVVYEASSARGNPALAGFLTAPHFQDMEDEQKRKRSVLELLEDKLGGEVHNYVDFVQKDWSKEPYNGGCFLKSLIPGTTKYFDHQYREPFDRIHFAGTETATVWCGFMNGAIQSGFRAATEVLHHIRPQLITSPDLEMRHLFDKEEPARRCRGEGRGVLSWLLWGSCGLALGCLALYGAAYWGSRQGPHWALVESLQRLITSLKLQYNGSLPGKS